MQTGDDVVLVNKTVPSPTSIALPAAPTPWRAYSIKDGAGNADGNPITLADPAGHTIDGQPSVVINAPYAAETVRWNRTEWSRF